MFKVTLCRRVIVLCALLSAVRLAADTIEVRNESDQACHCAIYYVKSDQAQLASPVVAVPARGSAQLARPPYKWRHDRDLLCRSRAEELVQSMTEDELEDLGGQGAGAKHGTLYHVAREGDIWKGYSHAGWRTRAGFKQVREGEITEGIRDVAGGVKEYTAGRAGDLYDAAVPQVKQLFGAAYQRIVAARPQYTKRPARVRLSNTLSDGEKQALAARMPRIKKAVETALGYPDGTLRQEDLPRVAIVASGGGYRAMLLTLGWLVGAEREGLLDMTTWLVGLSGSTWAMGSWLSDKTRPTVQDARTRLFDRIQGKSLVPSPGVADEIVQACAIPLLQDQPFTLVQIYGELLAHRLFPQPGDAKHDVYFSDQAAWAQTGSIPIPIFTAASVIEGKARGWFEFTPWEAGATWLTKQGAYIPMWAYGRHFWNGASQDMNVEKTLGFLIGTCGSAFAVSAGEAYEHLGGSGSSKFDELIKKTIGKALKSVRLTSGKVPNFTLGIPDAALKAKENMSLVDAGIVFNLPYPPVSGRRAERKADIVIFLDASAGLMGEQLCRAANFAKENGLPFPHKSLAGYSIGADCEIMTGKMKKKAKREKVKTTLGSDAVTVLRGENGGPTIIYVPRVNDPNLWPLLDNSGDPNAPDKFREHAVLVRDCLQCPSCKHCDVKAGFDIEECTAKGACGTMKLKYTRGMLDQLSGLAEFQMRAIADTIKGEIKQIVEQRRGAQEPEFAMGMGGRGGRHRRAASPFPATMPQW